MKNKIRLLQINLEVINNNPFPELIFKNLDPYKTKSLK